MGLFGRGGLKEIGKLGLNSIATPFEAVAGQNLYNPELEGSASKKIASGQEQIGQAASALVPMAASMIGGPGAGMAVSAAQGMNPNAGKGWDPNSMGAQIGNMAGMAAPLMGGMGAGAGAGAGAASGFGAGAMNFQQPGALGSQFTPLMEMGGPMQDPMQQQMQQQMPMGDPTRSGANLATFNGPSHEEEGINFNGKAEIEKQETVDLNKEFVYSDKLVVPGSKKTFADQSKKYKGSDTDDDITKNTNKLMLARLEETQEGLKKEMFEKDMAKMQKKQDKFIAQYGGYMDQYRNGGFMDKVSPGVQYGSQPGYGAAGMTYGASQSIYRNGGQLPQYAEGGFLGLTPKQINQGLMAAPGIAAFAKGAQGVDKYDPNYNEQYDKSIDLMSGRRYNAQPEIDAANRAQSNAYKQGTESAGGSAALEMANIHGAQVTGNRATQRAYANEQNMNNQYMGQEAQFRGQMGAQRSALANQAQQMDMRASAARDAYTEKGFDSMGQAGNLAQQNDITMMLAEAGYGDLGDMKAFLKAYGKNKNKNNG